LGRGGAHVWAWDDLESSRDAAQAEGISLVDLHSCDWNALNSLVLSPGIPDQYPEPHPIAQLAHDNDCEIICDVDLLARSNTQASYVGITGTNGKSTTTALIGHILKSAGRAVEVGGNFGIPVLELASLGADGSYVIELSSYQLERVPNISLDVAVLLNISSDHLDRHGGMDGYVAAKKSIFDHTGDGAGAVIGMEDGNCRGISLDLMLKGGRQLVPISSAGRVAGGVYVEDGMLIDDSNNGQAGVLDLKTVGALPGRHNWQNAAAAYAAAGRYDEATREVDIAVRSHPRNAKLRLPAAEIHTQAGQVPQAISHLEAAIQISPSNAQSWIQLAELEKRRENVADAYVAYRRAAELAPEDIRAVSGLALSADSLGFDAEARSAYARWAELERNLDARPEK